MAPDGWMNRRLSECADRITSGGTPKVGREGYYGGDIPFLKIDDLTTNRGLYLSSANASITNKALDETAVKLYPANTVLVTMYGTIGEVGITSVPMAANQAMAAFLGLSGVTTDFLAYLLAYEAPRLARKAGQTTQSNINGRILRDHEVLLPPLPEQRKIAAILSSVDDAIEKTETVIDQVQVVKRGLMQELLTRGLPGQHKRFKQTAIGEIPTEWTALTIDTLCNVVRGSTPRPARDPQFFNGTHVPWITVSEVTKDEWPFLEETRTCLTEEGARFSRYLNPGTVVLTNSGVTLGIPKLLTIGGCANDGIAAFLDVSESLAALFLYYALARLCLRLTRHVRLGVR